MNGSHCGNVCSDTRTQTRFQGIHFDFFFFSKSVVPALHLSPSGKQMERHAVLPGNYAFKSINKVNKKMPMEATVNGEKERNANNGRIKK